MSIHFLGIFSLLCVAVFSIGDKPSTETLLGLSISVFAGYLVYLVTYIYPIYKKWSLNKKNILRNINEVLSYWERIEEHIKSQSKEYQSQYELDFTKVYQFSGSPFEPDDPYSWNDGERFFQDDLVRGIDSVRDLMTRIAPIMDVLPPKLSNALIELNSNPWLNYKQRIAKQRKSFFQEQKKANLNQIGDPNHLLHLYDLSDFSEILPDFFGKIRATRQITESISNSFCRPFIPRDKLFSLMGILVLILSVLFIPQLISSIHESIKGSSFKLWLIAYLATVAIAFCVHFASSVLGKVKFEKSSKWKYRYLLFILFSPDYLIADVFKEKFDGADDRKIFIILSNLINLLLMIIFLVVIKFHPTASAFLIILLGFRLLSRGVEIVFAFTMDVISSQVKSSSSLSPNNRVLLAFSSLLEIIISYALLNYLIALHNSELTDLVLQLFQSFSVSFFVENLNAFKSNQNIGFSFMVASQIFVSFILIAFSIAKYIGDLNSRNIDKVDHMGEE